MNIHIIMTQTRKIGIFRNSTFKGGMNKWVSWMEPGNSAIFDNIIFHTFTKFTKTFKLTFTKTEQNGSQTQPGNSVSSKYKCDDLDAFDKVSQV